MLDALRSSATDAVPVQLASLDPAARSLGVPSGAAFCFALPDNSPELARAYTLAVAQNAPTATTIDMTAVLDGARVVTYGPPKAWPPGFAERVAGGELHCGIIRILRAGSGPAAAATAVVASVAAAPSSSAAASGAAAVAAAGDLSSHAGDAAGDALARPTGSLAKILSRALKVGIASDRGCCVHMEDASVVHTPTSCSFAFCGVFDGHGGAAAADFCKEHLHFNVMASPAFGRGEVGRALLDGFTKTESDLLHEQASGGGHGGGEGGGAPAAASSCCSGAPGGAVRQPPSMWTARSAVACPARRDAHRCRPVRESPAGMSREWVRRGRRWAPAAKSAPW